MWRKRQEGVARTVLRSIEMPRRCRRGDCACKSCAGTCLMLEMRCKVCMEGNPPEEDWHGRCEDCTWMSCEDCVDAAMDHCMWCVVHKDTCFRT